VTFRAAGTSLSGQAITDSVLIVLGDSWGDKEIRNRVKNDPHSLGKWRVDGALPHIDAWYEAFGVKQGDKLFIPKNQRLELW
jgi:putative endopeptidase